MDGGTGSKWRHGVFDAVLETLAEMVDRVSADKIDSTIDRAHHCAVLIERGLRKPRRMADCVAI